MLSVFLWGHLFLLPTRKPRRFFGLPLLLFLLLTRQLLHLLGLPSGLSLLGTCPLLRLLSGLLPCSLLSPGLGLATLSVALLCLAALFLQLVAFGHSAHWIQTRGQRLSSHLPFW